jgi:phage shock protein E
MRSKSNHKSIFHKFSFASDGEAGSGGGVSVMERDREAAGKVQVHRISPKEAKAIMDSGEAVTVLDVREPYEYRSGHIGNAVLLPSGDIREAAARVLPDKNAKILVYCLSGGRSGTAAHELVQLGYTSVFDFGGIASWPYDVVMD